MNYTQNSKIAQVTEKTLVVGVDIGSERNYARAFNWRGQEVSKKAFHFNNSQEGFQSISAYLRNNQAIASAEQNIVGCEPAGHYWFTLAKYLKAQHSYAPWGAVSPHHYSGILSMVCEAWRLFLERLVIDLVITRQMLDTVLQSWFHNVKNVERAKAEILAPFVNSGA